MTLSLGLPRRTATLTAFSVANMLALGCGGADFVEGVAVVDGSADGFAVSADALPVDAGGVDGALNDARLTDGTQLDAGRDDGSADVVLMAGDARSEVGSGVPDAGPRDADAALVETGRNDAGRSDAGDEDAHTRDASVVTDAPSVADATRDAGLGVLGSATKFAVLAGSTITISPGPPVTTIAGDVGVSPGTAVASLSPGQPTGGVVHLGDPTALQAQNDLTAAYNSLGARTCGLGNNRSDVDLGGKTLLPGVYCFNSSAAITGDLVLDAQGDPNAEWVFQIGTTLTTATNATVSVVGGSGCNVYWRIGSSATLGTGTRLVGNLIAHDTVTLVTGSTVSVGRILARTAAVNLDGSAVSAASCQ